MDRYEWTGLDGVKRRAVRGGGIRQFHQLRRLWVLCSSSGEASAEILRLAARVKELESEVDQELRGQVDVSGAAGREHDKAHALLERCFEFIDKHDKQACDVMALKDYAVVGRLAADLRRWLGLAKGSAMSESPKHPVLPFEWSGEWDLIEVAHVVYFGVRWLEDFGCLRAGEIFEHLNIDYDVGEIVLWSDEGMVLRRQAFNAVPKSEGA